MLAINTCCAWRRSLWPSGIKLSRRFCLGTDHEANLATAYNDNMQ